MIRDHCFPVAILVLTVLIRYGSCYTEEDIVKAQKAIGIAYLIFIILIVASGVISITIISCYICKFCPVAQKQRQEGTILSLPQHGPPGVMMSAHDMEMVAIARQPHGLKGYATQ